MVRRWVRRGLIGCVRFYQVVISPMLRAMNGGHGHCRHVPTCSQYSIESLRQHGILKGLWLTAWRILRCHPWGSFGRDPVPGVVPPLRWVDLWHGRLADDQRWPAWLASECKRRGWSRIWVVVNAGEIVAVGANEGEVEGFDGVRHEWGDQKK